MEVVDCNTGKGEGFILPGILGRMAGNYFVMTLQILGKDVGIQEGLGHQGR